MQNSPLGSSCVAAALTENYSTSNSLKDFPEKSHILSCDAIVANEQYVSTGAKDAAGSNSTEKDLWRRSARISKKDKIRNIVIKKKMNVTRSLLEDIKTKELQRYGHVQMMEEGRLPKEELAGAYLG